MQLTTRIFPALILLMALACQPLYGQQQMKRKEFRTETARFRNALNAEYTDTLQSPLTPGDFSNFSELRFFPARQKYRVAARLELTPDAPDFEMPRSKGNTGTYRKYGDAVFSLDGKECRLSLYQSVKLMNDPQHARYLFLPFADLTNGDETYSGGRFIDLEIPVSDTVIIDFNRAYNPLCAFNHKYSCPIPPAENRLDIKIKAGVKTGFKKR